MLNNCILMGRLVSDPELKTTNSGISVCSFRIAVDRNYAKQGEERQVDFINCQAWRQSAEFLCRYFAKGQLIVLDGSLQSRTYKDKNGNNRFIMEVIVNNFYFTGDRRNKTSSNNYDVPLPHEAPPEQQNIQNSTDDIYINGTLEEFEVLTDDDDLPF